MITHAEYHASRPLPAVVLCCNPIVSRFSEPRIGVGRVHLVEDGIRPYHATAISTEEYVAALSKTEWRDSSYLSVELDIDQTVAKGRMLRGAMTALTECKKVGNKWVWRLL